MDLPIKVPLIDIHTVGAGGGSIASVWIQGAHYVSGRRVQGRDPGPICYGNNGEDITVTDANLFLGTNRGDTIFGGRDVP